MLRALVFFVLVIAPSFVYAQQSVADRQRDLQNQLDQIEKQIAVQQTLLDSAQSERKTLQGQIDILNAAIKKTELQIKAISVTIQQIQDGIRADNTTLDALSEQLTREKASLAEIMRQTEMLDQYSIVEVALSTKNVSSFFVDLDAFVSIRKALAASFEEIAQASAETEEAKATLETKLSEQQKLQTEARLARAQVLAQEKEKKDLLTATKGQEAVYQKLLTSTRQTAAQIRAELFSLAGGGGQIPLPTAIMLAKQAGAATGVRPAFILAILRQETNLGANVGQCKLTNIPNKGDGKGINTGTVIRGIMKPTRDVDSFMAITATLGLDAFSMSVSCPQAGGYGGAMGPSQFIPSTWAAFAGYGQPNWTYTPSKDRIAKLAGHPNVPANPWNNTDAFTATALYMTDLGASVGTAKAERTAALKYFAGSNWQKAANSFYGDSVMRYATDFQEQIDILGGL